MGTFVSVVTVQRKSQWPREILNLTDISTCVNPWLLEMTPVMHLKTLTLYIVKMSERFQMKDFYFPPGVYKTKLKTFSPSFFISAR